MPDGCTSQYAKYNRLAFNKQKVNAMNNREQLTTIYGSYFNAAKAANSKVDYIYLLGLIAEYLTVAERYKQENPAEAKEDTSVQQQEQYLSSKALPILFQRLAIIELSAQGIPAPSPLQKQKEVWKQEITFLFQRKNVINPEQIDSFRQELDDLWQLTFKKQEIQAKRYAGTFQATTKIISCTFAWCGLMQLIKLMSRFVVAEGSTAIQDFDNSTALYAPYLIFALGIFMYFYGGNRVFNQACNETEQANLDVPEIISVTTFEKMLADLKGETRSVLSQQIASLKDNLEHRGVKTFIEDALTAGTTCAAYSLLYTNTPRLLYMILASVVSKSDLPNKTALCAARFFLPAAPHLPGEPYLQQDNSNPEIHAQAEPDEAATPAAAAQP
ncbi:MAG: hypothetical protein KAT71_04870 [Gammaproteobacteria bacterium]|nr:hypothetical protein [Gammaproteobacteria bacterium]